MFSFRISRKQLTGISHFYIIKKVGVDNMNYSEKKKSFTEKILKLFSHKLNKIEKRQMYLFILMILFFISQIFQTFYFKYTIYG